MAITPQDAEDMLRRMVANGAKDSCGTFQPQGKGERSINQSSGPSVGRPAQLKEKRGPNKWESEYATILEAQLRNHEIEWYGFEKIRIRLADGAWFKPDFAVISRMGVLRFIEVKGMWREAARVRIKVAAEVIPLKFVVVRKRLVRDGGGWDSEVIGG